MHIECHMQRTLVLHLNAGRNLTRSKLVWGLSLQSNTKQGAVATRF